VYTLYFVHLSAFKFEQCSAVSWNLKVVHYSLSRLSAVPFCSLLCHDSTKTLCAMVQSSTT